MVTLPIIWVFSLTAISWADDLLTDGRYAFLQEKYHIKITESTSPGEFKYQTTSSSATVLRWTPVTEKTALKCEKYLRKQLTHYPVNLVKVAGLKAIFICENLTIDNVVVGGIAIKDTIYINLTVSNLPLVFGHTFHHEFFHVFERHQIAQGLVTQQSLDDWRTLSGAAAYNADPHKLEQHSEVSFETDAPRGFVTRYSMSNVSEDRAEIFATNVLLPNRLARLSTDDLIIKAKSEKIRALLRRSCADVDEAFFTNNDPATIMYDR